MFRGFKTILVLITVFFISSGTYLYAEGDSAEELVQAVADAVDRAPEPKVSPEDSWRNFLDSKGWGYGLSEGGVIVIPERDIILSSASVFTKVGVGQPGWIESRVMAFQQAEMDAKGKIVEYLATTVETERSMDLLEKAQWDDGEVDKLKELSDIAETLKRIGKKSMALAEKKLDQALQKLDPEYDPSKYDNKSVEELRVIAQEFFQAMVTSRAAATLIGVTPLFSSENKIEGNEYEVLVGVIWSPKLNRLAMSLFNDTYNIPPVTPGKPLAEHIPESMDNLISALGSRIVVDENGHYAVMSYAQAQPRRTTPSRKQAALHQAKQIAASRAKGSIVNFIQEGMALKDNNTFNELLREFSDLTVGERVVREYQKAIKSKRVKVSLSGIRVLKAWSTQHPETGQDIAGAVLAWSPSSRELSRQATEMMQQAMRDETASGQKKEGQGKNGVLLESMSIDTSAY